MHEGSTPSTPADARASVVAVPMATITSMNAPGGAARYAVEPQHTLAAYERIENPEYLSLESVSKKQPANVDKLPPPKLTVTEKIQKSVIVHFHFNKAELTREGQASIEEIARSVPDAVSISVIGHADAKGTSEYNKSLSKRRADSVIAALEKAGVNTAIIREDARGADAPIEENKTVAGRSYNRRVEVLIDGTEHPLAAKQDPKAIAARVAETYRAAVKNAARESFSPKSAAASTVDTQRVAQPVRSSAQTASDANASKGVYPPLSLKTGASAATSSAASSATNSSHDKGEQKK